MKVQWFFCQFDYNLMICFESLLDENKKKTAAPTQWQIIILENCDVI